MAPEAVVRSAPAGGNPRGHGVTAIGTTAMVLAAGFGLRMRPLTGTRPKPLIEVNGKALIDYGFDRLREAGVKRAVVNVHYLPEQIEAWASRQSSPAIEISDERNEILDTGGGIARALARLGDAPFFVINSDSFWTDGKDSALDRLRKAWDGENMDCLLLLCPLSNAVGYDGHGDFVRADDGQLQRASRGEGRPLAYMGAFLVHPRLFAKAPPGKFSMNVLWNSAIDRGRLSGVVHTGRWFHVGTPDAIALAETAMME
jgi:N-acetyl-alpha-D-muramate 1-phosphate uridylyltransferase